jgi:hypothetical protein
MFVAKEQNVAATQQTCLLNGAASSMERVACKKAIDVTHFSLQNVTLVVRASFTRRDTRYGNSPRRPD